MYCLEIMTQSPDIDHLGESLGVILKALRDGSAQGEGEHPWTSYRYTTTSLESSKISSCGVRVLKDRVCYWYTLGQDMVQVRVLNPLSLDPRISSFIERGESRESVALRISDINTFVMDARLRQRTIDSKP